MAFDDLVSLAAGAQAREAAAPQRLAAARDAVYTLARAVVRAAKADGWRDFVLTLVNHDTFPTREELELAFDPPAGTIVQLNLWVTLASGRYKVPMRLSSPDGASVACAMDRETREEAPAGEMDRVAAWAVAQAEERVAAQIRRLG